MRYLINYNCFGISELREFSNESMSNYTLSNWPDGEYSGVINGYEVYSDDVDSGFKTTTGLRNMVPIPCRIYVEGGSAVVFYRNGVLFSDDEVRGRWKSGVIESKINRPRAGGKKRWSIKYKRSIDCSHPKGFSQKQYCRRKRKGGSYN